MIREYILQEKWINDPFWILYALERVFHPLINQPLAKYREGFSDAR
jgi:hypothetical protein